MKKYILWDHDGVLVDTEYWYFKSTQRALTELGVTLEKELYLQRMVHGLSSWDLALEAGLAPDHVVRKRQQRDVYYREYLAREDIEIPGVLETLALLAQRYQMAIVTTSKGADFEVIHKHRRIVPFMDFVLLREDYEKSKPDPEPYLLALQRFGATAQECLVVEDSQRGLQSAMAAGIDCAIVYNDFTSGHDFTGVSHFLNTISELPALIDGRR
jgi:HAD superfamily hydrolase (TIGR01509 family)